MVLHLLYPSQQLKVWGHPIKNKSCYVTTRSITSYSWTFMNWSRIAFEMVERTFNYENFLYIIFHQMLTVFVIHRWIECKNRLEVSTIMCAPSYVQINLRYKEHGDTNIWLMLKDVGLEGKIKCLTEFRSSRDLKRK